MQQERLVVEILLKRGGEGGGVARLWRVEVPQWTEEDIKLLHNLNLRTCLD